ncbi:hypothetical protein ACOME3_003681 [Neoechinorhynchus agilis]
MSRRFGGRNLPPRQTRPRYRTPFPMGMFDPMAIAYGVGAPLMYNPTAAAMAAAFFNPMQATIHHQSYGFSTGMYPRMHNINGGGSGGGGSHRFFAPSTNAMVPPTSSALARKRSAGAPAAQISSDDDYATDGDSDDESKQGQPPSKKLANSSGEGAGGGSGGTSATKRSSSKTPYNHPGVTEKQCELCGVVFTSKVLRDQHLKGKKHKKKLKFHMNKGETPFDVPDSPDGDDEADPADDGNDEEVDESGDVEMEVLDPHLEFFEELKALKGAILDPENAERISINAFQLFRIMEEYLRYITRRYVSPGIDPTRMSWNELLNVLKRNTIVKLSSNMERKLDNVRQLRNSVVHSFTAPVDIRVLTKVIKVAEEMYEWGVQFRDTTL